MLPSGSLQGCRAFSGGSPLRAVGRRARAGRVCRQVVRAGPPRPPQRDSGFFSEADTRAEVLPVKRGVSGDVTKRGGRWESDFIWNSNWSEALDRQEAEQKRKAADAAAVAAARRAGRDPYADDDLVNGKGRLQLANKVDLNDLSVDLSQQLRARPKSAPKAASGGKKAGAKRQRRAPGAPLPKIPVTRVEQRAWARGGKFATRVVALAPAGEAGQAELEAELAAERARYEQLKKELQLWCTGLTAFSLAATFTFYGRDVAASYGVGAAGGLLYLRLLNRSVEGVAGGLGGVGGSARLLIPLILALTYNRYNTILSENSGLELQLLPMLVGFFTYKVAVIGRQSLVLFRELADGMRAGPEQQQGTAAMAGGEGQGAAGSSGAVQSGEAGALTSAEVDRDFATRMLRDL